MYDNLLYEAYGYLDEADERLRSLERQLEASPKDMQLAERYLNELGRGHNAHVSFFLEIADLLNGKLSHFNNHKVDLDYQYRGKYGPYLGFINITISKVSGYTKGYLSLRASHRVFIFAEMGGSSDAPIAANTIRVVRGYSPPNVYGDTLAGWPPRGQHVWARNPRIMLDEMIAWLRGQMED